MIKQAIHSPLRTTFQNIRKNADRLIKKDPTRAIVELITNSDDSYRRLEKARKNPSGQIFIDIIRARPHSIIEVFDEAEGMDSDTMARVVQLIGREETDEKSTSGERGFFREGLKFAIIGMGFGEVYSIKDNYLYRCNIDNKGVYHYDPADDKLATQIFRDNYMRGIKGNGTLVRIIISRDGIKSLPLFEKIENNLSTFFSLRDLLSNQNREVRLIEQTREHKEKVSAKLVYKYPEGIKIFDKPLNIKDYPNSKTNLVVFKTEKPLLTKWDISSNDYRENGLLVRSGGAIHDITLFRFDNEDYKDITSHLYGFLTCEYIKKLMDEGDDHVINDSRDGINIQHGFIQQLKSAVEKPLKNIIDRERSNRERESEAIESAKIKKLIKKNLTILNQIARKELADLGEGPSEKDRDPENPIPPEGFNFFPETDYLVIGKKYTIKLIGDLSVVPLGEKVSINIDNPIENEPEVAFSPQTFIVSEKDVTDGIWVKRINLIGKKIDAQRIITAVNKKRTAEAVLVVTKGGGKRRKKKSSGVIKDVKFDPLGDPHRRVVFTDGIITIHTKAPSILRYFGPEGEGKEKLHSRILMAELITEALINHIARQKGLAGKLTILDEKDPQEAIVRERNQLLFKYAHLIHKGFVAQHEI